MNIHFVGPWLVWGIKAAILLVAFVAALYWFAWSTIHAARKWVRTDLQAEVVRLLLDHDPDTCVGEWHQRRNDLVRRLTRTLPASAPPPQSGEQPSGAVKSE